MDRTNPDTNSGSIRISLIRIHRVNGALYTVDTYIKGLPNTMYSVWEIQSSVCELHLYGS